jgi:hypothetical protein
MLGGLSEAHEPVGSEVSDSQRAAMVASGLSEHMMYANRWRSAGATFYLWKKKVRGACLAAQNYVWWCQGMWFMEAVCLVSLSTLEDF